MRLIFLAFLVLPIVEIALFIVIGQMIGLWPTLLGVLLSAVVGALVLRYQGAAMLPQLRAAVSRGQLPARTLGDGMLVGLGGVLLMVPGYFTSALGLLLLLPPVRTLLYALLASRVAVVATSTTTYDPGPSSHRPEPLSDGNTIDLDAEDWRQR